MGEQEKQAVYVVQRMQEIEVVVSRGVPRGGMADSQSPPPAPKLVTEKRDYWTDVATVSVPPKSKRATVIKAALAEAKLTPEVGGEPLRLRVLDAQAAHVSEVGALQPPVQLRIA